MRETGVVRIQLTGDEALAVQYIGQARTQLGILKDLMRPLRLTQLSRAVVLSDGTTITVSSIFGQDTIQIDVPIISVLAEEPTAIASVSQALALWWFNSGPNFFSSPLNSLSYFQADGAAVDVKDFGLLPSDAKGRTENGTDVLVLHQDNSFTLLNKGVKPLTPFIAQPNESYRFSADGSVILHSFNVFAGTRKDIVMERAAQVSFGAGASSCAAVTMPVNTALLGGAEQFWGNVPTVPSFSRDQTQVGLLSQFSSGVRAVVISLLDGSVLFDRRYPLATNMRLFLDNGTQPWIIALSGGTLSLYRGATFIMTDSYGNLISTFSQQWLVSKDGNTFFLGYLSPFTVSTFTASGTGLFPVFNLVIAQGTGIAASFSVPLAAPVSSAKVLFISDDGTAAVARFTYTGSSDATYLLVVNVNGTWVQVSLTMPGFGLLQINEETLWTAGGGVISWIMSSGGNDNAVWTLHIAKNLNVYSLNAQGPYFPRDTKAFTRRSTLLAARW